VTVSKTSQPDNSGHCDVVTVSNPLLDELGSTAGVEGMPEEAESLPWRISI
jgi:hypothetical protein